MEQAGRWLKQLPELNRSVLGRQAGPITFLLGAGASRTSNAPSTAQVAEEIRAANSERFASVEDVYKSLVVITEGEKRAAIEPLFEQTTPYIGYQLLAALGHSRPVTVVNLNWDKCVLQACDEVGVEYRSHDLAEPVEKIRASLARQRREGAGVVDIHVHGRLGTGAEEAEHPLRFALLETFELEDDELQLLRECFDSATVIAGASLCGRELDTAQLIEALRGSPASNASEGSSKKDRDKKNRVDMKPVWVAVRERNGDVPDKTIYAVLAARQSSENVLQGPDVDFDRIMWSLRAADAGYEWEQLRENHPEIELIEETGLMLPAPALLRDRLAAPSPVLVLPGRGRQGKSTVAHILAHWLSLCRPHSPLVRTYRAEQALEALGVLAPGDVLVIDDPFGEDGYVASPQVYDRLRTLSEGMGQVIVASRFEAYQSACHDEGELLPAVYSDPSIWWSVDDLELYAQRFKHDISARVRDDPQLFNTPFQVKQGAIGSALIGGDDEVKQITDWLSAELGRQMPYAALVLVVRLQDFYKPMPASDLEAAVGYEYRCDDRAGYGGMLRCVAVDKHTHLRISHPEDIHAVDRLIVDHRAAVEGALAALALRLPWVWDALGAWDAVVGAEGPVLPGNLDDRILFEWTFELVQRAATRSPVDALALLEEARKRAPDSWAYREMVFAAVFVWRSISDEPKAVKFLEQVVRDHAHRGAYALVEALLRVRVDTPTDLVAIAVKSIYELARAGKTDHKQLILIFDAMLWRDLPVSRTAQRQIFELLLKVAHGSDRIRAGFAAAAAYHRPGLKPLLDLGLENPLQWTAAARKHPEVVVWLLQWHVAHQARAHAIVTRQSFLTPDSDEIRYLGRGEREPQQDLQEDQVRALHALIGELKDAPDYAGWAVHLAVHVNSVAGALDTDGLSSVVSAIDRPDTGLASCGLYKPPAPLASSLSRYLNGIGRKRLLEILGEGFEFEGVRISAPRFRLAADGWEVRKRWHTPDAGLGKTLGVSLAKPSDLLETLLDHTEEALELDADQTGLKEVLLRAERGDTSPLEQVPARPAGEAEHDDDPSWIATVLAEASRIVRADGRSS